MFLRAAAGAVTACSLLLLSGTASAKVIGTSLASVQRSYPSARLLDHGGGSRVLELRGVDYAGVRWATVDFRFADGEHLSAMTMTTRAASYEQIRALAQASASAPSGLLQVQNASLVDDSQLRICEEMSGDVSLTYEASTTDG